VHDFVDTYASARPDDVALIDPDGTLTWGELAERRELVARGLRDAGIAPGETVALYETNSTEYFVLLGAVQRIGATAVQVNWRSAPDEVRHVLDDSGAVAVLVHESFLPVVDDVVDHVAIRNWWIRGDAVRPWAGAVEDLVAAGAGAEPVDPSIELGASMLYTGGTTGRPKGVRRPAMTPQTLDPSIAEDVGAFMHTMHLDLPHVHLVTAALYHAGPMGYATMALAAGGKAVIMRKFDAETAYALIEEHGCTSTFMPPVIAKRMLDVPAEVRAKYDVSSMDVFLVTAGPVPQKLKEDILDAFGPVYYEAYGTTETSYYATALTPADVRGHKSSCGRVVAGPNFTIRDEHGELPVGEVGLVCWPYAPTAFPGYHNDDEMTRSVFIEDGWITVGDVGRTDEEGFLYIVDRARDMIISGGSNIYSAEIEGVLHEHPAIADVAVFGVPDEEWGERVHAALQLHTGTELSLEDLQAFARTKLAGYKVPRQLSLHDTFPRDAAGKLAKRSLRDTVLLQLGAAAS
jgi:long-chain acyl-CoA synthetase